MSPKGRKICTTWDGLAKRQTFVIIVTNLREGAGASADGLASRKAAATLAVVAGAGASADGLGSLEATGALVVAGCAGALADWLGSLEAAAALP